VKRAVQVQAGNAARSPPPSLVMPFGGGLPPRKTPGKPESPERNASENEAQTNRTETNRRWWNSFSSSEVGLLRVEPHPAARRPAESEMRRLMAAGPVEITEPRASRSTPHAAPLWILSETGCQEPQSVEEAGQAKSLG